MCSAWFFNLVGMCVSFVLHYEQHLLVALCDLPEDVRAAPASALCGWKGVISFSLSHSQRSESGARDIPRPEPSMSPQEEGWKSFYGFLNARFSLPGRPICAQTSRPLPVVHNVYGTNMMQFSLLQMTIHIRHLIGQHANYIMQMCKRAPVLSFDHLYAERAKAPGNAVGIDGR